MEFLDSPVLSASSFWETLSSTSTILMRFSFGFTFLPWNVFSGLVMLSNAAKLRFFLDGRNRDNYIRLDRTYNIKKTRCLSYRLDTFYFYF